MKDIRQGIKRLIRRFKLRDNQFAIVVSISRQRLYLFQGMKLLCSYPVSTSRFGIGNRTNSYKTPTGTHLICQKIGRGAPPGTIFISRKITDKIARIYRKGKNCRSDYITTRILRLKGLEPGINRGRGIDTYRRKIYIHGTPAESLLGRPASKGCIRMANRAIIELFSLIPKKTLVEIQR